MTVKAAALFACVLILGACQAAAQSAARSPSGISSALPSGTWVCRTFPADGPLAIVVGGKSREALVHVPPSSIPANRFPVVLVLHGLGDTGHAVEGLTAFSKKADEAGFVAVYPQALGDPARWDISGSSDTAFVAALLTTLEADPCVDPTRVYATGMSMGGGLTNALGCRLSVRLAAIAPVAGLYGRGWEGSCSPTRAMPVLAFHGVLDPIVPYAGGSITDPSGTLSDAPHVVGVVSWAAGWAARNHCDPQPIGEQAIGNVVPIVWRHCAAPVELYRINDGGHSWPGSSWDDPGTNRDISATDLIWQFFKAQALPST
jgi:polyhydroxybutyrate depolymerase